MSDFQKLLQLLKERATIGRPFVQALDDSRGGWSSFGEGLLGAKINTGQDWDFDLTLIVADAGSRFPAHGQEGFTHYVRDGAVQVVLILSGVVVADVDGISHVMRRGDAITIHAGQQARFTYQDAIVLFQVVPSGSIDIRYV